MLPSQIQALVNKEAHKREVNLREKKEPVLKLQTTDGHPWYNDLSHTITDSTIFRLILIYIVVEWIIKKLG